jgi:nucleoside-specific outer membrane channel protein Tsx
MKSPYTIPIYTEYDMNKKEMDGLKFALKFAVALVFGYLFLVLCFAL